MSKLSGYRTYLLSACGAILTFSYVVGWVDRNTWEILLAFILSGSGATIRSAIKKR